MHAIAQLLVFLGFMKKMLLMATRGLRDFTECLENTQEDLR